MSHFEGLAGPFLQAARLELAGLSTGVFDPMRGAAMPARKASDGTLYPMGIQAPLPENPRGASVPSVGVQP